VVDAAPDHAAPGDTGNSLCTPDGGVAPPLSTTIPVPTVVNHRLTATPDATSFDLTVDTTTRLQPAAKRAGGVSVFALGWDNDGAPWDSAGTTYKLSSTQDQAISGLQLPNTRTYGLADESFGINAAIDLFATFTQGHGIPEDTSVLELEDLFASTLLSPADWAAGVQHSVSAGYQFHNWEIANEPYYGWDSGLSDVGTYVTHVQQVSQAIRAVDSKAVVGAAICRNNSSWNTTVIQQAAGSYDWVDGHYYSFIDPDPTVTPAIEDVALAENFMIFAEIVENNSLLVAANPGGGVYQYDTEWGNSANVDADSGQTAADFNGMNANINGALHRAVRLLYYAREGLMLGANSWQLLDDTDADGFALIPVDSPQYSMLYWVYSYFNQSMGDWVVDISGSTRSYTSTISVSPDNGNPVNTTVTGPQTPAMATLSDDGTKLQLMVVNGSWSLSFPMQVSLKGFAPATATGVVLSSDDRTASPVVSQAAFVSNFPVTVGGPGQSSLTATLPPHAIVFITVTRAPC
jgi:hypothetical protein